MNLTPTRQSDQPTPTLPFSTLRANEAILTPYCSDHSTANSSSSGGVVVAEVAPARTQCGKRVAHALEVTVRLVHPTPLTRCRAHHATGSGNEAAGRVGSRSDAAGAPDEEFTLHEALVHAEVAA